MKLSDFANMHCNLMHVSKEDFPNSVLHLGHTKTIDDQADNVQSKAVESDIKEGSDSVDDEDAWDESSTTEQTVGSDSRFKDDTRFETTRELKESRRRERNQARFAALKERQVRRVEEVLHPGSASEDKSLDTTDPLKSPVIKNNLAFNSSTFEYASLRTDIHTKKVQKNKGSPTTPEFERGQSQDAEITMFVQQLGVDVRKVKDGTKEQKSLLLTLHEAIRQDLECVANDDKEFMKRMAGYWRYANKRIYNIMVQNNQIWDWETGAKLEKLGDMDDDENTNEADYPSTSDNPSDHDSQNDEDPVTGVDRLTLNVQNGKWFSAARIISQTITPTPKVGCGPELLSNKHCLTSSPVVFHIPALRVESWKSTLDSSVHERKHQKPLLLTPHENEVQSRKHFPQEHNR